MMGQRRIVETLQDFESFTVLLVRAQDFVNIDWHSAILKLRKDLVGHAWRRQIAAPLSSIVYQIGRQCNSELPAVLEADQ